MDPHMQPHMPVSELAYFKLVLQNAKRYLEIGCGGSTYLANTVVHDSVFSIESDPTWIQTTVNQLPENHKVTFHAVDIDTLPKTWGYPGPQCPDDKKRTYSRTILEYPHVPDVVLIDGRFRVACALHLHSIIDTNTIVLFDDFANRREYKPVLDFFEEVKRVGNMVHLRKKEVPIPSELIATYELDPR